MVGGTVKEIIILDDRVWVNTQDGKDECAIYVEKSAKSRTIAEGDALWWQAGNAYWTPKANRIPSSEAHQKGHKCGIHSDIPIP